ncbi:MAG: hypothetical protein IJY50_08065 [Clostridia bacterium]|nr:hypothetical protein [Clostridia bacterium]
MAKLKHKIDLILWAFVWMLPVFAFFVSWYRIGSAPEILTFIDEQFAFPFIRDIINNVWTTAFGAELQLAGFLSYLICVEVAHCLFDAVVFIPRFAHSLIEKGERACTRE